jgi:hypothetical protein
MTMEPESEKYKNVINILRKSKPVLNSTENIQKEVIKKIERVKKSGLSLADIIDFLFSWVYIGWIRRSLIIASIALVVIFVYQQAIILRRIDFLSRQTIVIDRDFESASSDEVGKLLMVYRNSGRRFPLNTVTISEKQMNELLESINELKTRYKDLENIIDGDPELKKLIEEKIKEKNRTKLNL